MKTTQDKKQKKPKLENLKKNSKPRKKKKHGGARKGAGRKLKIDNENVRKMKELIEGHGLEVEEVNGKKVERVKRYIEKNSLVSVILIRLIPSIVWDVQNLILGLTKIKYWKYIFFCFLRLNLHTLKNKLLEN